jgi:hypothetical protein
LLFVIFFISPVVGNSLTQVDPFLVIKAQTKGGSAGLSNHMATMQVGHVNAQTSGPVCMMGNSRAFLDSRFLFCCFVLSSLSSLFVLLLRGAHG